MARMKMADDLPLPFPPDDQQIELMSCLVEDGNVTIASEGTDRFEIFSHLVEQGYMLRHYCPEALGVYQFSVTLQGLEVLQ